MKVLSKNYIKLIAIITLLISVFLISFSSKNFSLSSIFSTSIKPASDAPHSFTCNACHLTHTSPGITLTSVNGNANLCISCHNPAGMASAMPFSNSDIAEPGTGGTSHAWDKPATNVTFGANLPTQSSMLARVINDTIICSTCHDQHSQTYTPFLRASNSGDALCKDCHSIRDVGRYSDDPVNHKGSHPVGLFYDGSDPRLLSTPTLPLQTVGSNIECSSCHQVHFATTNDGNLLRSINDNTLCAKCHTYKTHKSMDCNDCHKSHNPDKTNIMMINNLIASSSVIFSSLTGTNSFGDADATVDGVCQICHPPNARVLYHRNDGTNLNHYAGQNCTSCHPHDMRFYPQTNCLTCHSSVQGTRRQIVSSSVGDFVEGNHHMSGKVEETDCVICHYMGEHRNGTVMLMDPDQGDDLVYTYNAGNLSSVENFCINCHDSDGRAGNMTPFSGGTAVPIIDNTKWTASSHKTGTYSCMNCHDNGHGSNKSHLLAPSTYAGDGSPDPWNDQEEFCESCHNGSIAVTDIESEFNLTHTHQVDEVAQFGTNSGLECVSCHNPHYNTTTYPLSDPDNNDNNWIQISNGDRDFCLKCHDGTPPVGISFPLTSYGTGWNKSNYTNSRHDEVINFGETNYVGTAEDCRACHQHHGASGAASDSYTGIYTMIKGKYDKSGNSGSSTCNTWDNNVNGDYQLCWDCHNTTLISNENDAFDDLHKKHVDGADSPCILCHDVHNSYDPGERGLVTFEYGNSALANSTVNLFGHTLSTSIYVIDSNSEGCYTRCHDSWSCGFKGHNPRTYNGNALSFPWSYTWPK